MLSVYRDLGVVPREGREDNYNKPGEDLSAYRVVHPGDLVLNKMKTWQGSLGISSHMGIVSPAYFVCVQTGPGDGRFLHHLLRSQPLIHEYARRSKGIRPAQWDLPWDEFRSIFIRLPDLGTQRAIADYLDAETARIDALIEKKQQMQGLIGERLASLADRLLQSSQVVRLKWVADLLPGFTFPSGDFGPEKAGARLLRGVNVGLGSIRWDDSVQLEDHGRQYSRYRLFQGDVVLGMDRPFIAGGTRVAVVQEDDADSLLVQRVCRIRSASKEQALVIRWALASRRFQVHVEPDLTGVSVPHLSEDQIASFPIPAIPPVEVGKIAAELLLAEGPSRSLWQTLRRQLDLLQEHRQALITAAVTGEFEVPGLAA
jgi:type I restriction enzyme S subunit